MANNINTEPKKTLVHMNYGRSWTTPSGVKFTKEHPYQLVEAGELTPLLAQDRFRRGRVEDLKTHYQLNPPADINELVNGDTIDED